VVPIGLHRPSPPTNYLLERKSLYGQSSDEYGEQSPIQQRAILANRVTNPMEKVWINPDSRVQLDVIGRWVL
jgi:hypothetical protein